MATTNITLDGSNYVQLPSDDALYNDSGVYVNLTMSLENWNYEGSSQIVGNYNGQGYGVFYNRGFEDNPEFNIMDSGNLHLFNFNHTGGLISQRSTPTTDAVFTASMIDHLGNKYYFDQFNLLCYRFDSVNDLKLTFPIEVNAVISVIVPDELGNVYFMDTFAGLIHKYKSGDGTLIESTTPEHPDHNNMIVLIDGTIKTFFSTAGTPMLVDTEENTYNIWGANIYKNGTPWFFVNPSTSDMGIDMDDNIWVVYNDNRIIKMNTFGVIEFDKVFHNIKPCNVSTCETVAKTTDKVSIGFTKFDGEVTTWVVLNESNYLIQLSTSGGIKGCELVSNLLDESTYTDAEFSSMDLMTNGDFTGFNSKKRFNSDIINNSNIVAKIALLNPCDSSISYKVLTTDVTSLDSGEHNIVFGYNPVGGVGELIIDGVVKDSFTQSGLVYYKVGNKSPYLIGADSGNYRSAREEQGMGKGGYLKATITDILISTKPQTDRLNNVALNDLSIELPTTYPISFKERVDKFFLMRPAGFKSTRYSIDLNNTGITDTGVRSIIEGEVSKLVRTKVPIHNTLDSINWFEDSRLSWQGVEPCEVLSGCDGSYSSNVWIDCDPWIDAEVWVETDLP
jgi:hypothetical protein